MNIITNEHSDHTAYSDDQGSHGHVLDDFSYEIGASALGGKPSQAYSSETPQAADIKTAVFQLANARTRITKLSQMTNLVTKFPSVDLSAECCSSLSDS